MMTWPVWQSSVSLWLSTEVSPLLGSEKPHAQEAVLRVPALPFHRWRGWGFTHVPGQRHFKLTFLPLCFKFQFLSLHSLLYTKLLKSPTALQSKIFQKAVMPNLDWLKWNQTEGKIFWTFPCLVHCLRIWQQVIKIDYSASPHETSAKLHVWLHYSLIQTREASWVE